MVRGVITAMPLHKATAMPGDLVKKAVRKPTAFAEDVPTPAGELQTLEATHVSRLAGAPKTAHPLS
jgi:hypothetical protein